MCSNHANQEWRGCTTSHAGKQMAPVRFSSVSPFDTFIKHFTTKARHRAWKESHAAHLMRRIWPLHPCQCCCAAPLHASTHSQRPRARPTSTHEASPIGMPAHPSGCCQHLPPKRPPWVRPFASQAFASQTFTSQAVASQAFASKAFAFQTFTNPARWHLSPGRGEEEPREGRVCFWAKGGAGVLLGKGLARVRLCAVVVGGEGVMRGRGVRCSRWRIRCGR